jgi:hypothetical protein
MATTTASRFLTVTAPTPNLGTGWTVRILDYKDMTSLIAICAEYSEMSFTQELNGTGTGSITLDEDSPWWTNILNNGQSNRAIMDYEYVFEAWENGIRRFAWLGQTVTNTVTGEDETHAVTISGPGIAQVLSWACINRPGWPTKPPLNPSDYYLDEDKNKHLMPRVNSSSDMLPALLWRFPVKWPTMRTWSTVFQAAQRRGLIKFVTPMFTALKDSGKQDWVFVKTLEELVTQTGFQPETPSESLLDFLNDCTGQDYSRWFGQRLEWIMHPGFKLDVRRHIGVDRSGTGASASSPGVVRFFSGQIRSNERTRDRENIYNRIIAVDVDGAETIRLDKKSVAQWNLREQRNETNKNVTDPKLRDQLADRYVVQSRDQKDEWSVKIPYDDPGRVPFANFGVGDYVGINDDSVGLTPSATAEPTKYRVLAITVHVSADSQVPDCELTLKSMIDSKFEELQKQITRMLNEPVVVTIGNIKEISIPSAPKEKSTLVYDPKTKKWTAQPVTSSADGGSGGTGTSTGGPRIFIQNVDPATQSNVTVSAGDFWLETYD